MLQFDFLLLAHSTLSHMGDLSSQEVVIRPVGRLLDLRLPELWAFRELLYFLVWRDVKVRYKQTFLGASWAILQPVMLMVVFTIFLGRLAGVGSEGVPYPIFTYVALVPWTLFAQSVNASTVSLVGSANLVSKVYFPRLLLPIAATGSFLLDFGLALGVLGGMMVWYGIEPTVNVVWLPAFTLLSVVTALSVGTWFAALNARYRDVQYAVPFLIQVWLFASPVAYPSSRITGGWRIVYGLNPMAGVVEGFRWALLGTGDGPGVLVAVSCAMAVLLLIGGILYFQRVERTLADVI